MILSDAAGGKHAVDMGMMLQSLVPGMQHAEEPDLRTDQNDCENRVSRNSSHRQTWISRLLRVSHYRSYWAVTKIPCVPKSLLLGK